MNRQRNEFDDAELQRIRRALRRWRQLDENGDPDSIYYAVGLVNEMARLLDESSLSRSMSDEPLLVVPAKARLIH